MSGLEIKFVKHAEAPAELKTSHYYKHCDPDGTFLLIYFNGKLVFELCDRLPDYAFHLDLNNIGFVIQEIYNIGKMQGELDAITG